MKVLIVEDNKELSDNVRQYLSKEGCVCDAVFTYQDALNSIISFDYDMVILDIMLPDGSGIEVLKNLKLEHKTTGVLIISARDSLTDKLVGLDYGADDYLTKPFHLSELNARLKAVYRRRNFDGQQQIVFNEITIDPDKFEVTVNGDFLILTRKEHELLVYFLANKNRVLTKQSIAEHLWGDQVDLYDSFDFVYQHIKNLRKKITKAGGKDYLQNIYGLGYKFNPNP